MRSSAALLLVVALLACERAPPRVSVALADAPTRLGPAWRAFRPAAPLEGPQPDNAVCVRPPAGYELRDDWTLGNAAGHWFALRGEITLADGRVERLTHKSWSGTFCLHPERPGPLLAAAREVRLWSSDTVTVESITWRSTDK